MLHYLIFLISFFIDPGTNAHDHYVSITTININKHSQKLEVTLQLTAHDIEYYFEKEKNIHLHLGTEKENPKSNQAIAKYIQNHLTISVDDKPVIIKYLGKETKLDETLWLYFEGDLPKMLPSISIKNDLLLQSFENQQNIVHLEGLIKESFTFNGLIKERTFYKQ